MKIFFRVLGGLLAIFFIWCAALQYNDPDSTRWYMYYGIAALASLLFVFDSLKARWALLLFAFYCFMAYRYWPTNFEGVTIGEGDIVNIEMARESMGMGISAIAMLIFALRLWISGRSKV